MVEKAVRDKCNTLFRQWAVAYKDTRGLEGISTLYKQLPNKPRPVASQSKVIRETEQDAARDEGLPIGETATPPSGHKRNISTSTPSPAESSSSNRRTAPASTSTSYSSPFSFHSHSRKPSKNKAQPFSLEKEKPQMLQAIAGASVASTNLTNALKLINRESQLVSEDSNCVHRFDTCKLLRRQILRYIQLVESDQWIGSLLTANDELVKALMAYEVMDKSVDDDSDSDAEVFNHASASAPSTKGSVVPDLAGLNFGDKPPAKPPRPGGAAAVSKAREDSESEAEEADENDPFGDQNEIR